MNTARKIESVTYPRYRRHSDRVEAVRQVVAQVEREHAPRQRRMLLLMAGAAALLLLNAILIAALA